MQPPLPNFWTVARLLGRPVARPALPPVARLVAASLALALVTTARPAVADPPAAPDQADAAAAPAAANPTPSDPAVDTWIQPEDVADRADALSRQIEAAQTDPTTDEMLARLTSRVNEAGAALDSAYAAAKSAIRDGASLMSLQDARQQVEGAGRPFPEWQEELADEGRRLAGLGARLEAARQLWTRTGARPETQAAGEIVVRRVERSIQDIEAAAAHVRDLRGRVLALNDRIVDHDSGMRDTLHNLEVATRSRGSNLAVPDRAPLWRRGLEGSLAAEWPLLPGCFADFQLSTMAYLRLDGRPFLLQGALLLVLLVLFRRMRTSVGQASFTEQMSEGTVRLLSRPYAMAVLMAILPTPALHPTAPRRVTQLLGMLALFPVARILSLVNRRTAWPLYAGLLTLLLLDRIAMSLTTLPTVTLLVFLAEIVILWSLAFAYRRRLREEAGNEWLVRVLGFGMRGMELSLLAEIGGWSALAAMVGRLVLVGGLTGVLIAAATLSAEALLAYALASPFLRNSRFVNDNQELVHRWSAIAVRAAGVAYWLRVVVTGLGLRAVAGDAIDSVLEASVTIGALSISLGGTLAFLLTIAASMVVSRVVHEMLEDEVFPRMNLPRGIPHALLTLANYTVWALGFLLALAAAGVQMSQLAILLGGLGVGIGLGLQDVVKNFAAGITLLLERRVHVGDTVELPGKNVFGRVLSVGMRASVVRNWNGTEVVMPNGDLVDGTVTNWTLSDPTHRIEVPVQVSGDADPEHVIRVLLAVAAADPGLLANPAPSAHFLAFGPGTLDFRLRAWTGEEYEKTGAHTSRLTLAVFRALQEAGISLPDNTSELTLVPSGNEPAPPSPGAQGKKA